MKVFEESEMESQPTGDDRDGSVKELEIDRMTLPQGPGTPMPSWTQNVSLPVTQGGPGPDQS